MCVGVSKQDTVVGFGCCCVALVAAAIEVIVAAAIANVEAIVAVNSDTQRESVLLL